jgi:HEAT repeat protein
MNEFASDPELERLIEALNDLTTGERAAAALIARGRKAVPALRRFLLEGRLSTVYHPRRWAVSALGGIGAVDVLLEYLGNSRRIDDPQLRFAEEPVQNAAIRELAARADANVVRFLLDLSARTMLPSLAETFGQLQCAEALPFLDRALEDDVCRPAAEDAFRAFGPKARSHLAMSAVTPRPSSGDETPSSLLRRRSALSILGDIGIEPSDWALLRSLIGDEDPVITVALGAVALNSGILEDRRDLVRRLIQKLPVTPWYLLEDVERCLTVWFEDAWPLIEREIDRPAQAASHETARFLARVLRKARRNHSETAPLRETA